MQNMCGLDGAAKTAGPRTERYMRAALEQARAALDAGEIAVGAVVVARGGTIIGRGRNMREEARDVCAHAEICALRDAARNTGDWRLAGATVFVTLEPCAMCAAAIAQARCAAVVYGAYDEAAGCAGSAANLLVPPFAPSPLRIAGGIMREECAAVLCASFDRKKEETDL